MSYGWGGYFKERNTILNIIKNYFSAYIFDEGIHPEFMKPNFKFKKKNLIYLIFFLLKIGKL